MYFTRSSETTYHNKEENYRFYGCLKQLKLDGLLPFDKRELLATTILDSSLISQTKYKKATHKIVKVGEYYQVYEFSKKKIIVDDKEKIKFKNVVIKSLETEKIKKDKKTIKKEKEKNEEYKKFNDNVLYVDMKEKEKIENFKHIDIIVEKNKQKKIELKNIIRSKMELERIVKSNEKEFKTFVTLTFKENLKDIEYANKCFNSFRTYIKKLKNDFKYVAVPEFQKRGAVHYHLLTNIDYNDLNLLSQEEKKLYNRSSKKWQVGKNIIGWSKGFSLVKTIENVNIVAYISKYMTKDIDNRLWGKRRYYYSQSLIKPETIYLNIDNIDEFALLVNNLTDFKLKYKSSYLNKLNETINFYEYKKE